MSDDLSLLLKVRGDAAGGKAAVAETRAAIASLRATTSTEFAAMGKASKGVFDEIGSHLNFFVGERIPLLGGAFIRVTENIKDMGAEAENAGGTLAALGGVGGIVTIGFAALAAAAVGAGFAIFEIVKKSSEVGLELEHLIEQTGLTAKTITSLKFAADESGKSIEGFDRGMKLFENTVAAAAEGSDKAAAALTRLGVTPQEALADLDGALAKVFKKIYDAPSGVEKVSLASDAFGKRMGSNLIPLIEAFHGDLGELIKRAEELGATLDDQGIHALAEFQKNMNALGAQALGLERIFAVEVAPTITQALRDLSKYLSDNRASFSQWGSDVGSVLRGIREVADSEVGTLIGYLLKLGGLLTGIVGTLRALKLLGAQTAGFTAAPDIVGGAAALFRERGALEDALSTGRKSSGGKGAQAARDTGLQDAFKEAALVEKEALQIVAENVAENKRALDEQVRDITEFTAREKEIADQRLDAAIIRINAEQAAIEQAFNKKLLTHAEFEQKDRELSLQTKEAVQKNSEEIFRLEQERDRKIAAAEQSARERQLQIAEDADKRTIDRIQQRVKEQFLAEAEGERQIAAVIADGFARRKKALEDEDAAYQTSLERHKAITDELIRLEGERAAASEDAARRIEAAETRKAEAVGRSAGKAGVLQPIDTTRDAFGLFDDALKDHLSGDKLLAAQAGLASLESAFKSLAQGVGDAIQAFVLFGNAGGGIKKFTATLISEIARMAAVQAVWELAQGLAMLALNFFWPDPKLAASATAHFHAAAVYGGLALVAAAAGRAVEGNSFSQPGSGGGTSGSGGGNQGRNPSDAGRVGSPSSQDTGRVTYQIQPVVHITVTGQATEGFTYMVENAATKSVRLNGVFRKIQNGEDV